MFEVGQAAAGSGADGDERDAEVFAQGGGVDAEALALGAVHLVERDDEGVAEVDDLEKEIKVAFEVAGIENAEDKVGCFFAFLITDKDVAGDFFIGGICFERVRAGEIDEFELVAVRGEKGARFSGDGGAGVVADLLVLAGEGVEKGGFSGVGISDQGNFGLKGWLAH